MRAAVEYCSDCGSCQDLMEGECRFFAQLFPLDWIPGREPIADATVRELAEACTYCGLCPCPEIPARLTEGKAACVEEEGLPFSTRLLTDVPRLARLCGTFPRVYEALQSSGLVQPLLRKVGGIHPDRAFPRFARESFFAWAARTGRAERREGVGQAAYFAGCTVGYLFPEVGRAVVAVLERNGVQVYVPPQECCGMPFLVEGDLPRAVARAEANVRGLLAVRAAGDEVVSSCPTCGYFLKVLLRESAEYSEAYQRSIDPGVELRLTDTEGGCGSLVSLAKAYQGAFEDDGPYATIPALDRIAVAGNTSDTGDLLARLLAESRLDTRFGPIVERVAYFPPCHQRDQTKARPYAELLRLIPGMTVEIVGEDACCGMGGNVGFKAEAHAASLEIGRPLFEGIDRVAPDAIVTECLSCRLQFNHALGYPVYHPMEVLARAYGASSRPA